MRPGVFETRASVLRLVRALRSEDFPTLERPAKAISGGPSGGRSSGLAFANINSQGPANSRRPVFGEIAFNGIGHGKSNAA